MRHSENVVCPGCTLLCDDIQVQQNDLAIIAKNACQTGQAFFDITPADRPTHYVANQPAELETAISAAAETLRQSQAPLICGLEQLSTQSQQVAWKIADQIGATIDTTFNLASRASMFALQRVGKVTASLGEVTNRSDLIVFWFCDPETTHPRLMERLNQGSSKNVKRHILVIDERENATAAKADEVLILRRDRAAALLAVLRASIQGFKLDGTQVVKATGMKLKQILTLADRFQTSNYGAILFGQPNPESSFDLATDSLSSFVRELNNVTRFVGIKLRNDANAQSAEDVLSWSSGYPFAVSHNRGLPRFHWHEYAAKTILDRRECDAVLFATGPDMQRAFAGLSHSSREFLGSIPTIALSPIANFPSTVAIQVGTPGLESSGDFCRFDGVWLPLTNRSISNHKSVDAAAVLTALQKQLRG